MRVVGLDLSLTATGIAAITDTTVVHTITSKGAKDATLTERRQRLDRLELAIAEWLPENLDLIVVEAPSFGQMRQAGEHARAGLWWRVVSILDDCYAPVAEVPPATLKKYVTGKGNAGKDEVLLAVSRRYPDVDVKDNNQADALVLAAMGARRLGFPIDDMPKAHLAAMDAVRWPVIA